MAPLSKSDAQRPSRAWEALTPPLSEWILDAISAMNFTKMTPVQSSTIPLFIGNKDVVVEAVTGSGKTLAFLIPVVERLLRLEAPIKRHHVGAMIISPTRELATQIHRVLQSLLAFHAPSAASLKNDEDDEMAQEDTTPPPTFPSSTLKVVPQLLLGGSTTTAQDLSSFLKNSPNLLIGTPGRLLELVSSQHVHCPQSSFEVLVLDEADRLLDLGFKDDLQKILSRLPKQRRTGLFSASVSEAVDQLIRVGLRNPVRINVKVKSTSRNADGSLADKRTPASLQMSYLITPPAHKIPSVASILESLSPTPQKTILYVATCYTVDYFQHILPTLLPYQKIFPLHGKHPDKVRRKNFSKFVDSTSSSILLTTDVAARGLDIPTVDLVLQLDPPSDPKTFIHRCGRAGRAGRKGLAITFLTPGREEDYVEFLRVRQTPISILSSPTVAVTDTVASSSTDKIREIVRADRALHDKAQRGFVSWVQAYRKHAAGSLFRVTDLKWDELGNAWGLLKLPSMPELKKWEGDRSLGVSLDWNEYAYKDKQREKQRRADLGSKPTIEKVGSHGTKRKEKDNAWSEKKDQKVTKELRREKKKAKREHERKEKMSTDERQKEDELNDMIARVRQNVMENEEFEGFSD